MSTELPKNSIPWTGLDVLLFLALWLAGQLMIGLAIGVVAYTVSPTQSQTQATEGENQCHEHPIQQLVQQSKNSLAILLVAFMFAVVAVPLVEEFLFRLLFQGWLEATLRQFHMPYASGISIIFVSLCFAAMHGVRGGSMDGLMLLFLAVTVTIFSLSLFALGMVYLKEIRNVKLTDLFGTERFFRPRFFTYAGCCLLALLLTYGLNGILDKVYPDTNTDPIPIFFISLVFGTLYSRTRNISYSILLHACLNGTSLALLWLTV